MAPKSKAPPAKVQSDSDSSEPVPKPVTKKPAAVKPPRADSDSDTPVAPPKKVPAPKVAPVADSDSDTPVAPPKKVPAPKVAPVADSDDDVPAPPPVKATKVTKAAPPAPVADSDDDAPAPPPVKATKVTKAAPPAPVADSDDDAPALPSVKVTNVTKAAPPESDSDDVPPAQVSTPIQHVEPPAAVVVGTMSGQSRCVYQPAIDLRTLIINATNSSLVRHNSPYTIESFISSFVERNVAAKSRESASAELTTFLHDVAEFAAAAPMAGLLRNCLSGNSH